MNKDILRKVGFNKEVNLIEQRKCPLCEKDIEPLKEFKDSLSKKEFNISGMCQDCQDKAFGSK